MKDGNILFSAPMIRANLEGRKTETRRMLKPQPMPVGGPFYQPHPVASPFEWHSVSASGHIANIQKLRWRVGGFYWVRESWRQGYPRSVHSEGIVYRADAAAAMGMDEYSDRHTWKPSRYMPRWASRMTIEVTEIKVERLQEITEEGAIAEGVRRSMDGGFLASTADGPWPTAKQAYAAIWLDINGPDSWRANPWVCVIRYKLHRCNIDKIERAAA